MTEFRAIEKTRLAIVATHPIQHFVPLYRALAADSRIELHVIFGSALGVETYFDAQMQTEIAWKMDMLAGYSNEFLEDIKPDKQTSFWYPSNNKIGKRLSAFDPQVVLVYGYAQINVLRTLLWCRTRNVPALMISDSERSARTDAVREGIKRLLIPPIYRNISAFLSVGDRNEDYYRYYGAPEQCIFRSPFTIDEDNYTNTLARRDQARDNLRGRLGLDGDAVLILYVGKLYPGKRPADLVDAMVRLRAQQRCENLHVIVAGNGEQFDTLRRTAHQELLNVHFLGFVNVDELPAIYAGSDALVVPSEIDRHPLVCSEAACMGLPIIISDRVGAVGMTDIARPDVNALVYPCGDVMRLSEAMASIVEQPDLRNKLSLASHRVFSESNMQTSVNGIIAAIYSVRR
jgi:glycosyltransferase involved in cell wall biosynthesis